MKFTLILLAVSSLAYSAPQPRKLFHEHFNDFINVINEEVGDELAALVEKYSEFDEFWVALDYVKTNDFKNLVYEMESLPEFQAVVAFLENDNIDIIYFIDLINDMIENFDRRRIIRQEPSGKDFTSFLNDMISLFPKDKLDTLYHEKMDADEEFRVAMVNLLGEEWHEIFSSLWDSSAFQAEVQTLLDHGIDVHDLLREILAVFGQN